MNSNEDLIALLTVLLIILVGLSAGALTSCRMNRDRVKRLEQKYEPIKNIELGTRIN